MTATATRLERSASTTFQADFKTATSIPANGKIVITFSSDYSLSGVTGCAAFVVTSSGYATIDGGFSASVSGSEVTCTRDNSGSATVSGKSHAITISTVQNPSTAG